VGGDLIVGEVVYIDHFGNAVTSIDARFLERLKRETAHATCANHKAIPIGTHYKEVETGKAVALVGSSGFVEISINRGNAATSLGLRVGDIVEIR
jgi:S-adenosyl-L-methionine hydrolase (adenosine-forming)